MTDEWTVWDDKAGMFVHVRADSWEEAVFEAYRIKGFLPRHHRAVRPRTGSSEAVRDREKFREFMEEHF